MNRVEKLLREAYEKTFLSDSRFPMAAILAQGKRIISIGVNREKTHPRQLERTNSIGQRYGRHRPHAELDCLIRADYEAIAGGTMYVARRKKNMDFGLAKPCGLCLDILAQHSIKQVYYTLNHSLLQDGLWYGKTQLE